jgi:replicative DNA helicase
MEMYASLLSAKPSDVDFDLFESSREKKFLAFYFDKFGELPPKEVFEQELEVELPTVFAPWPFYENKLKEAKFISEALPALVNFNKTYETDQKEALLKLREQLVSLAEPNSSLAPVSIVNNLIRYEHFKDKANARILTGIKPLDEASGGLSMRDEFVIISARLGIGKSWLAHAMATNMTLAGYRVGLYSGEMSEDEVGARFDSLTSNISNYGLTRGHNYDLTAHKAKLKEVQGDLLVLTPEHIRRNARPSDLRKFAKEYKLDVLFIDQISLMEPDGDIRGEAHTRVAALSLQLKTLQQELRIPLVAVNQLNRGAVGQEPDPSNLSGSDRLGQDATLILALGRKDDVLKIKVLKARSFRIPDSPWEFTWDIDKGILEPRLSAMDAVRAKVAQANARQAAKQAATATATPVETEEDDEIW